MTEKDRIAPDARALWNRILSRIDKDTEIQIIASNFTIYALNGFSAGFRRAKDVRIILTEDPLELDSLMNEEQFSWIRKVCGDVKDYAISYFNNDGL